MALINCPDCGRQVSDKASACPDCGCPINTDSPVSTPNTAENVSQLLVLAHRARQGNDTVNAKRYYDQILEHAPGNWEGIFYSVYFDAMQCKIMNISSAANSVAHCIHSTFCAISDLKDDAEKDAALNDVINSSVNIASFFVDNATNFHYSHINVDGSEAEYRGRIEAARTIYQEIDNAFYNIFPEKLQLRVGFTLLYKEFLESNFYNSRSKIDALHQFLLSASPEYAMKQMENRLIAVNVAIEGLNSPNNHSNDKSGNIGCGIFSALLILAGFIVAVCNLFGIGMVLVGVGTFGVILLILIMKSDSDKAMQVEIEKPRKMAQLVKERDDLQKKINRLKSEIAGQNSDSCHDSTTGSFKLVPKVENALYYCKKCGNPGPYEGACPNCGSTEVTAHFPGDTTR